MRFKSFFWQVFFALVLICTCAIILFHEFEQRGIPGGVRSAVFVTLVPVLLVSFFMAYRLSRPLESLRHHLKKMAGGDISDRMQTLRTEVVEIHELAEAMEKIRDQLQRRIQIILAQKNELDALLASMVEGVVAIDNNYQILHMNRAAALILGVSPDVAVNRSVHEVIRVTQVIDIVEESLKGNEMLERDIELAGLKTKYLQMHSSPMRVSDGGESGVVLVFSDVSRLRELEGMRKNFVSNVSHELRTPLTSIQGFAETLLNPAVKEPEEIKKFLTIIQRHATRLGRIIEDILALSRIERDSEANQIELAASEVKPILTAAVELCQQKADKKKIVLQLECSDGCVAMIDPYLLEQAVVNLIDNAIRYSESSQPVRIFGERQGEEVIIGVEDKGVGIPEKQLPRIFERFYRVDKARSRELGGTGLGLSIVKHITIAHRGRIDVQSTIGKGSIFTIHLPALTA